MTTKYRTWVCALAVLLTACAPTVAPGPSLSAPPAASPSVPQGGLVAAVAAKVTTDRRWYLVADGLAQPFVVVTARFDGDPAAGRPMVTVGGAQAALTQGTGTEWTARVPLRASDPGLAPGEIAVSVWERIAGSTENALAGKTSILLSQPEYVVWTLDFEGDASGDAELANTAAIADGLRIPMAVFWNPRAWTTQQVSAERQDAMLQWTKDRQAKGDEIALHLHMWLDYVRAAGVAAKPSPSWAGRGDGYDVPMTAYTEVEQRTLIDYGVRLMADHGLPKPTSFRAGGDIGDAATLRAAVGTGFNADCTAVAKDYPAIGRIPYPWDLPAGAQPYQPSRSDANLPGDLPLLEAPTIGGNTYAYTVSSIQPQIRTNLALFAPGGQVAAARKTITIVSHPGTIVPAERAAIEALLHAFDPLRYDQDHGPVRFVTMSQLARAYGR